MFLVKFDHTLVDGYLKKSYCCWVKSTTVWWEVWLKEKVRDMAIKIKRGTERERERNRKREREEQKERERGTERERERE